MKPTIIYLKSESKKYVTLEKKELDRIIQEAYNQGIADEKTYRIRVDQARWSDNLGFACGGGVHEIAAVDCKKGLKDLYNNLYGANSATDETK